jgi:hypothetical protein
MITNFRIYENFGFNMDIERSQASVKILQILSQIQIFHWQADKMGVHKTFDDFSDEFKENADTLMEVIQGKYGRVQLDQETYIPIRNLRDLDPYQFADNCVEVFRMYQINLFRDDQEIVALMDEIIAQLQQLKYLLTFN